MKADEYDVIIIGAGIGGLVCGCYLAKYGLKVLIVEKNSFVGGYVSGFSVDGFTFNTCVRGFVGCGNGGIFQKILLDLSLVDKLKILRPEIYDIIQFSGYSLPIYNNPNDTIEELIKTFPAQVGSIKKFFSILTNPDSINQLHRYRNYSFQELIDEYFSNNFLKFFLTALRIDSGEPPSKTSALADLMLIRGNLLDGGYFPKGGMQSLSNTLRNCFVSQGGEIRLNSLVKKIQISNNISQGVFIGNDLIRSKVVVSNSDAKLTYMQLLEDAVFEKTISEKINSMIPSTSLYIMYLAIKTELRKYTKYRCAAIWNFGKSIGDGIVCTLPSLVDDELAPRGQDSVTMYYGMPFKDEEYWQRNNERVNAIFIKRFQRVFPIKADEIKIVKTNTPIDLRNMTLNQRGASRGWNPSVAQTNDPFPSIKTPVQNVFLVGHWVATLSGNGGITFSAWTGKKAAKHIIKSLNS